MLKTCVQCEAQFKTKDSRRKTCSRLCAKFYRLANPVAASTDNTRTVVPTIVKVEKSLPPPEELPAPYAKRVHDMWAALVGDAPVRIA